MYSCDAVSPEFSQNWDRQNWDIHTYIQICNTHNVCQLAESEAAQAVTGGIWHS